MKSVFRDFTVLKAAFLLRSFGKSKEEHWPIKENFSCRNFQVLTFQAFKSYDVVKHPNMKKETHFGNKIWPVHIILQKKRFYQKVL